MWKQRVTEQACESNSLFLMLSINCFIDLAAFYSLNLFPLTQITEPDDYDRCVNPARTKYDSAVKSQMNACDHD